METLTSVSIAIGLVGAGATLGTFASRWALGPRINDLSNDLSPKLDQLGPIERHLAEVVKLLHTMQRDLKTIREDQIRIMERQEPGAASGSS